MAEPVGVAPAAGRHPAVDLLLELGIAANDGGNVGGGQVFCAEVNMQPAPAINPRTRLMLGIEGHFRLLQPEAPHSTGLTTSKPFGTEASVVTFQ